MVVEDMRKFAAIVLLALVAAGTIHLARMAAFDVMTALGAREGSHAALPMTAPDCPMGYVCPMRFDAAGFALNFQAPDVRVISPILALTAFFLVIFVFRNGYAPPPFVSTPTAPTSLRSVFKRE
jgi:hypothetical protein